MVCNTVDLLHSQADTWRGAGYIETKERDEQGKWEE